MQFEETTDEMLFSSDADYLNQKIVIVLLVVTACVPIVITNNIPNVINQPKQNTSMKKVPFEEYYIEHNVSEGAAKQSFFEVGVQLIDGVYLHRKKSNCFEKYQILWESLLCCETKQN